MTEHFTQNNYFDKLVDAYTIQKKPIKIQAFRITWDDFEVETPEGIMKGAKGDWLMVGVNGEIYVCKNEIFEKSYDIVESPD